MSLLSRDGRQIVDWLAVGKFAVGLAAPANEVFSAMKQGLPLARFEPRTFREGIYMRATQGSLSVLYPQPPSQRDEAVYQLASFH